MIFTFSGASGSGKTTISGSILKKMPNAQMVVSYTTRSPRDSDMPGEYRYVSHRWFRFLEKIGTFLWTIDLHGNRYGTSKSSINQALRSDGDIFFMIIFDRVKNLIEYAKERGMENMVTSFYLRSPHPEILRKRLQARGDTEFEVAKRLKDCEKWDAVALASGIQYIFVSNEGSIEDTVDDIIENIKDELDEKAWF